MIRIGITMGDPKGIGPEIVAKAWKIIAADIRPRLRIYGDRTVLEAAAKMTGAVFDPKQLSITSSVPPPAGNISDPDAARITLQALDAATADAKSGVIHAMVTAPINKMRMQHMIPNFSGHTEHLAKNTAAKEVVMMFACPHHPEHHQSVRISLVTSHLPLKEISTHLTKQRILTVIHMTVKALQNYFNCQQPRIAVLGMNPHAGDNGALGTEELEIIKPAIDKARKEGVLCLGPLVTDVVFRDIRNIDFDAIVAMYHDQGITPMKIICPKKSVNVTLGLPFVRTSPAHGTAEDIAWRNQASEEGMVAAIEMALQLTKNEHQ